MKEVKYDIFYDDNDEVSSIEVKPDYLEEYHTQVEAWLEEYYENLTENLS